MSTNTTCDCPACRRTMAITAGTAPASRLRCPHCQQTFTLPIQEAATRTLEQAAPVTATLPRMSSEASHELAEPNADPQQRTFTLDPHHATKTQSSATAPAPRKIGRFEIRRVLGEGGFGIVYEAYDPQLDRAIALKVAKLGGDSEQRIKRFLREAKSAANLRHPHIVPLFEFGQDGDQFYLALAYIPGQSLNHAIDELNAKKEKMDCRRAATLVRHLSEALAYAHGLGIVHRDIKPHNVMLDERGDPLLMDFGLAAREMDEKLTREGAIMGTAAYLAPEQYRGEPTAASDQYSLGVTLYELLTGETPFAGPPDLQIYHHVYSEPESPRKRNPAVTRDLETICLKCVEKDAAKRYADCRALADELRRCLDGEPIMARPIGVVERVRKWSARNPLSAKLAGAAVLLAVLVVVMSVVGATVAGYFAIEADRQAGLAIDETKKAKLSEAKEKKAREDADQRREEAEEFALRVSFESFYTKSKEDTAIAMVGTAQLLPKAAKLKNRVLYDSMLLHVGGWATEQHRLTWICEHDTLLYSAVLSRNGKRAVTGSFKAASIWDVPTGKRLALLEHGGAVKSVALSADGLTLLTGSFDGAARVWGMATGKPITSPLLHKGPIEAVALSGDGKIALTGSYDKSARLWDTTTGKPNGLPLEHLDRVVAVALSGDGKIALTGSHDKTGRIWDTTTGKPIGPPLQHEGWVRFVALSADGKAALTLADDFAFLPDYEAARFWDTSTGSPVGPPLRVRFGMGRGGLRSSLDGAIAISFGKHAARLWETKTGKIIGRDLERMGPIEKIGLTADGNSVVAHEAIGPPMHHQSYLEAVALSPDGGIALTASSDKTARLWNTRASAPRGLTAKSGPILGMALSADGKVALMSGRERHARLFDTETGKAVGPPLEHGNVVWAAALSADGKTGLTGSLDKTARIWQTFTGKQIGLPLRHDGNVLAVALSADGKIALTGSEDRTARLWDALTGKSIGAPMRHLGEVGAVALSADGKFALTGSADNTAVIWDTATQKALGTPFKGAVGSMIQAVALSADGKIALTADLGGEVVQWNVATGQPVGPPLRGARLCLGPDAKIALTWSFPGTAQLWELPAGKPIGPPLRYRPAAALSSDGRTVFTGSEDKTARLWKLPRFTDDPERILLWAQVITGIEVDKHGNARALNAATWQQRRQRLQELGGPPEE